MIKKVPKEEQKTITQIGEHLQKLSEKFEKETVVGNLYGFNISVKTEKILTAQWKNIFFVVGESGIKYTHQNEILAKTPNMVANSFVAALEKIVGNLTKWEKDNEIELLREELKELQEKLNEDITLKDTGNNLEENFEESNTIEQQQEQNNTYLRSRKL